MPRHAVDATQNMLLMPPPAFAAAAAMRALRLPHAGAARRDAHARMRHQRLHVYAMPLAFMLARDAFAPCHDACAAMRAMPLMPDMPAYAPLRACQSDANTVDERAMMFSLRHAPSIMRRCTRLLMSATRAADAARVMIREARHADIDVSRCCRSDRERRVLSARPAMPAAPRWRRHASHMISCRYADEAATLAF